MIQIHPDLYQFTSTIPQINFTIHQYLLDAKDPILAATGTMQQAEKILPEIKTILNGKPLRYILISHMESDECGGLAVFREAYPEVTVICSALAARELSGFGYGGSVLPKTGGDVLAGAGFSLRCVDYPSEIHLQNGLVFYEETRKIFFSSDLMLRFGEAAGKIISGRWNDEVDGIGFERVPNENKLQELKTALKKISPAFLAAGHGFCMTLTDAEDQK
ncbi:MAG: hypothetical protein O0V67_02390 [Methanocorpusculum sp.]|nr:hypothetical protein [Methanocorpusculum sp.]